MEAAGATVAEGAAGREETVVEETAAVDSETEEAGWAAAR